MASIGDFFKSAATCQPVNPKKIQFTATSKEMILPSGEKNPNPGGFVRATVNAVLIFLTAEEVTEARIEAQRAMREHFKPKDKDKEDPIEDPLPSESDFQTELMYHILQRSIREYEEETPGKPRAGAPMLPSPEAMRKLVVVGEANRLMGLYNAYVASEHPEGVDRKTFREAKK